MTSGTLYIIAAPSGGGKTSIVNQIVCNLENIKVSVSFTTRPRRDGEIDGENYYFVDESVFFKMVEEQALLEHAEVFGNYYGTSKQWVEDTLATGVDVILEIDWQGARQICAQYSESIGVFILPPSLNSLEERLRHRGQDKEDVIAHRMSLARDELSHCHEFEYWVINDEFEHAVEDIQTIVKAQRLRSKHQRARLGDIVQQYLSPELTS